MSSRTNELAGLKALAAGLSKNQGGQTLAINDTQVKVTDIVATFDTYDAQVAVLAAARAAVKNALAAVTQTATRAEALQQGAERYVRTVYGPTSSRLAEYGLTPATRREPTVAVKTAAVAKSKATREARQTMGKRQKADIHGTPAATATPPVATPQAPAGGSGVKSS